MHVAFPFFLLPVATGIRIMYCMNDTLRDYQQEMKLRLFKEWELHRSVMVQMPTGTGKTHLLAAIVREFLRGSGSRVWIVAHRRELVDQIEETVSRHGMSRGRKGEGDVHPVAVTKPEKHGRRAGPDRYRRGASRPGGNLPDTLGELSGGKETGHDRHSLPAERQGIHGLVRQPDHFVDCRGIHRKGLVVIL